MSTQPLVPPYPARLQIDYPDRLDRLSTLLRIVFIIPALILVTLVTGAMNNVGIAVAIMLLFRRRYPPAWFAWARYMQEYSTRVGAYFLLLTDQYPSTTEAQSVHLELDEPSGDALNRFLPLVKWLLALPHYIVLVLIGIAAVLVTIVAWFAILVTGRYPRGLFDFVVGMLRWGLRVTAYVLVLNTDRYPPFSLR